jgi:diguanylate cyclase (GGDEF)-like protein
MPVVREQEVLLGLVTFLAIPLRHQQKCIGALLLASKQKDAFSSHQSRILSILCNQAAVSLENASIIRRMEELAITDGLTGLYNHRFFKESLDREWDRAERLQQPLCLLLMDIDHFKGFNDSFGHPAGDFVLKSLAALLKGNARKIDILARYGGEEFAALLPGIDLKDARKTAERWRKTVQRAYFKTQNKSFTVTLSIGFAGYPKDATDKKDLMEKADRALYQAKQNGRTQVRHFNDVEGQKSTLFG